MSDRPDFPSDESRKVAADVYHRHAVTPEEIRYLMTVRKLTPELREKVFALCDTLLLQHGNAFLSPQPVRHPRQGPPVDCGDWLK